MTQTASLATRRNVALFSDDFQGVAFEKEVKESGDTFRMNGVPVFRSGTFRDSMGYSHQWEDIHMDQMVTNFNFLRDRGIFKDVPVRVGHPSLFGSDPVVNLAGYVTNLYKEIRTAPHDGKEYSYLMVDVEILNKSHAENIKSGLFRNRSSEIGSYVTNDDMELWPTFMGFAFVDIPAVEGLNFSKESNPSQKFSVLFDNDTMKKKGEGTVAQGNSEEVQPPKPPALGKPGDTPDVVNHATPAQQSFTFNINGQETTDFQAVQDYVNTLEQAAKEQQEQAREAFVDELFSSNKIVSAQLESFKKLTQGMSAEQFQIFRESYEGAPVQQALAAHSQGSQQAAGNPIPQQGEQDPAATQIIQDREIVYRHRDSGMSLEAIKKTGSYKRLEAANAVPAGF